MGRNMSRAVMTCAVGAVAGSILATGHGAAFEFVPPLEVIPPGEAEQIRATAEIMTKLQDRRAATVNEPIGILLRGVHPKSHGCVKAEFVINKDIDEKYRVGLFATPGKKFDAWIRYSNAAAVVADDLQLGPVQQGPEQERKNGSRGMAIKILDVEGEFLSLDSGRQNQDFLMINTPMFAFPDVRNYLRLNEALLNPKVSPHGDKPDGFFLPLNQAVPQANDPIWGNVWVGFDAEDLKNTKETLRIIKQEIEGKDHTVRNPLQVQYFGAAPFLFGEDRAMKVSAAPCKAVEQPDFPDRKNPDDPSINYLGEALTQSMKGPENICFEFKIQTRRREELRVDQIENATTLWPEELTSYENVARITIPVPQAPDAPEAVEHCKELAFTPFHSLAAHRPIGGINRLRREVYESSATHRRLPPVSAGTVPPVVPPGTVPPVVPPGTVY